MIGNVKGSRARSSVFIVDEGNSFNSILGISLMRKDDNISREEVAVANNDLEG